jgi:hypothetical protein
MLGQASNAVASYTRRNRPFRVASLTDEDQNSVSPLSKSTVLGHSICRDNLFRVVVYVSQVMSWT